MKQVAMVYDYNAMLAAGWSESQIKEHTKPWPAPDNCAMLQRELKTSQRWTTGYRRLALLGWLAFLGALLWQPSAHADTLPAGSLACVDAATWAEQQNQTMFEPAVQGCVYTYHDFEVSVVAPGVVRIGDLQVWVFAAAVQP